MECADALTLITDLAVALTPHRLPQRTEKGELSVKAHTLQMLSKALLPLPDKWHGGHRGPWPRVGPGRRGCL